MLAQYEPAAHDAKNSARAPNVALSPRAFSTILTPHGMALAVQIMLQALRQLHLFAL